MFSTQLGFGSKPTSPVTRRVSCWRRPPRIRRDGARRITCARLLVERRRGRTVPAQQRFRPDNLQSVQHPGSQAIKPNKQQPVDAAERDPLRGFAPQHVELMAKDKVFGFQRGPWSEHPDQGAPDQSAKIAHRSDYQPIREGQSAALGLR